MKSLPTVLAAGLSAIYSAVQSNLHDDQKRAAEEPDLLVDDLRAFFRDLR